MLYQILCNTIHYTIFAIPFESILYQICHPIGDGLKIHFHNLLHHNHLPLTYHPTTAIDVGYITSTPSSPHEPVYTTTISITFTSSATISGILDSNQLLPFDKSFRSKFFYGDCFHIGGGGGGEMR